MNSLVSLSGKTPTTTSLAIAQGVGKSHKTVLQLIRQNQPDFEEFGPLAFEMRVGNRTHGGGQSTQVAILNEQQATLLMTYMRNSEKVREFKKRLVKAFYELAQQTKPKTLPKLPDPISQYIEQYAFKVSVLAYENATHRMRQYAEQKSDSSPEELLKMLKGEWAPDCTPILFTERDFSVFRAAQRVLEGSFEKLGEQLDKARCTPI